MFEGMTFNTTSSGLEPAEPETLSSPSTAMWNAHVIEDDAAHAGEQERKKRTDQETFDTLERNSAKRTGIGDLSYC